MDPNPSRKRPLGDIEISGKPPPAKKVRFPKGKKVKKLEDEPGGGGGVEGSGIGPLAPPLPDPSLAAKERAKQRSGQIHAAVFKDDDVSVSAAEVNYGREIGNDNFVEDGVQFEPFNLDKEREEGYFDADGNFVEYVDPQNKVKDAWLDSLDKAVDPNEAAKFAVEEDKDEGDNDRDLTSDELGKIKRRIADALEPEETVLQALRRLKGNKKEKMGAEAKAVFDQLTEDAMALMMKNGENNVYDEEKEVFEREAQGYESLARARTGPSILDELEKDDAGNGIASIVGGNGNGNGNAGADDGFDMFGDDDEPAVVAKEQSENNGGGVVNDYVLDESSGYYYSSSLGYYYDPNSCLYYSSGIWYSLNAETGSYDEIVPQVPESNETAATTTVN